jgi:hypothetical protein
MCQLSRNLGASTSWSPKGLSRSVMGRLYLSLGPPLVFRAPAQFCVCSGYRAATFVSSVLWYFFTTNCVEQVRVQKLVLLQLRQKFPSFCGTRRFVAILVKVTDVHDVPPVLGCYQGLSIVRINQATLRASGPAGAEMCKGWISDSYGFLLNKVCLLV